MDLDHALAVITLLDGTASAPLPAEADWPPVLAARHLIDCGERDFDIRSVADVPPGPTTQAEEHAIRGAATDDEDEWHAALALADQHGLRLIAVDALEALGVLAAHADSETEALRLIAAAHRLRDETGYRWRFSNEQARLDAAVEQARSRLGDRADDIWCEGLALDWHDAIAYARRSRGQRQRPRHGWASLTPTEHRVAELAAQGLSNPEIADRLLMGRGTVKSHLEHIYAKTGHRNRTELTAARHQTKPKP